MVLRFDGTRSPGLGCPIDDAWRRWYWGLFSFSPPAAFAGVEPLPLPPPALREKCLAEEDMVGGGRLGVKGDRWEDAGDGKERRRWDSGM